MNGPTVGSNRVRAACAVAALASAFLAGCTGAGPSPAAVPRAWLLQAAAPSEGPATTSSSGIELHALDPRFVPNLLRSSHGQVLWSGSRGDLWRYVPDAAQPERLYTSPNGDVAITDAAASAGGYALVERSSAVGDGGWRVWYLSGPGGQPVELDRGQARNAGHPPTLAMDDARIAWAAFDEPASGWVSRLRIASLGDLGHPTTLLSYSINEALLWYPCLNGDELWYAIIHPDFDGTGAGNEFHLEMLDLSNAQAQPVRFAGSGNDFNPAVNDGFIAWKTAEGDSAALNWGTIHVQERGTQSVETVPVPNANRPSIGGRYLAFDEITHSRLAIYDLTARRLVDLGQTGADGPTYGGLSVSGNLLTWFTQGPDMVGLPRIGWAILPDEQ